MSCQDCKFEWVENEDELYATTCGKCKVNYLSDSKVSMYERVEE